MRLFLHRSKLWFIVPIWYEALSFLIKEATIKMSANEEADFEVQFQRDSSGRESSRSWISSLCRIEIAAFIQTFSYGLHGVIRTNLLIEKSCRVNLNYSKLICDSIDQYKHENDQVQENVTSLNLYFTFLAAIPWYAATLQRTAEPAATLIILIAALSFLFSLDPCQTSTVGNQSCWSPWLVILWDNWPTLQMSTFG